MEKTQRFTWNVDKVLSLIESTYHFKVLMEYYNVDFQGDKPKMYEAARTSLADKYENENICIFGPVNVSPMGEVEVRGCWYKTDYKRKRINEMWI